MRALLKKLILWALTDDNAPAPTTTAVDLDALARHLRGL